jgi:penicillin-binding protein 2
VSGGLMTAGIKPGELSNSNNANLASSNNTPASSPVSSTAAVQTTPTNGDSE